MTKDLIIKKESNYSVITKLEHLNKLKAESKAHKAVAYIFKNNQAHAHKYIAQ